MKCLAEVVFALIWYESEALYRRAVRFDQLASKAPSAAVIYSRAVLEDVCEVLTVLHRRDGDDRMPVVGRADEYHIKIFAGDNVAEVPVGLAILVAVSAV